MEFAIALPQTYPDPARLQRFLKRAEELPFVAVWCIEQVIGTAPVLESVTTLNRFLNPNRVEREQVFHAVGLNELASAQNASQWLRLPS